MSLANGRIPCIYDGGAGGCPETGGGGGAYAGGGGGGGWLYPPKKGDNKTNVRVGSSTSVEPTYYKIR